MRGFRGVAVVVSAVVLIVAAGSAGAAPAAVDIALAVGASTNPQAAETPSGGTARVSRRTFYAYVDLALVSIAPGGRPKVRVELGNGLAWGSDAPDPTEGCTLSGQTAECVSLQDLRPISGSNTMNWVWDVVAPGNGSYSFRAEIVAAADTDPDTSNNASAITIVVDEQAVATPPPPAASPPPAAASPARVAAGSVRLSPAAPRAGSVLVSSVRVTKGGSNVRPTGVTCSASVAGAKVRTTAKAAPGTASCLVTTPRSGAGKTLAGSLTFSAGGTQFTKRFALKLR